MDLFTGGRRELRRQLELNPDWESDLLALYGFDIWDAIDGRVPIRQAVTLINRLSFEPMSIWRAKEFGGPELESYSRYIGWDANSYILADVVDAVNSNTSSFIAANSSGNNVPELKPYPRPGQGEDKPTPVASLDDFVGGKLMQLGIA